MPFGTIIINHKALKINRLYKVFFAAQTYAQTYIFIINYNIY